MKIGLPLVFLVSFSFTIAFGVFDPIFGLNPAIGLIDIFAFALIAVTFMFSINYLMRSLDKSVVYLFLFLFSLFLSSVIYGYTGESRGVFNFKLLVMIFLYMALITQFKLNPRSIHYCLLSFSIGVFVFILLLNTVYSHGIEINKDRLWVFGENPNSTSARFALAAIYFIYISIYNPFRSNLSRYLALLGAMPIIYVVFQSGSRGSILSVVVTLGVMFGFSNIKLKYKFIISLLLLGFFPYIFSYLMNASSFLERLGDAIDEGGIGAREAIWLPAIDIIVNNPIFGVGEPGYFYEMRNRIGSAKDTHNLVLYILAAGGMISFIFFVYFYKRLVIRSYAALRYQDVLPLALLLNITLIALKTGGVLTYSMMWFVFAIIASYPINEKNELGQ